MAGRDGWVERGGSPYRTMQLREIIDRVRSFRILRDRFSEPIGSVSMDVYSSDVVCLIRQAEVLDDTLQDALLNLAEASREIASLREALRAYETVKTRQEAKPDAGQ